MADPVPGNEGEATFSGASLSNDLLASLPDFTEPETPPSTGPEYMTPDEALVNGVYQFGAEQPVAFVGGSGLTESGWRVTEQDDGSGMITISHAVPTGENGTFHQETRRLSNELLGAMQPRFETGSVLKRPNAQNEVESWTVVNQRPDGMVTLVSGDRVTNRLATDVAAEYSPSVE